MPPSWLPLCRTMQVYCEPFFAALDYWTRSKEEGIMFNRIKAVETIGELFLNHSQNPVTHHFELVCQNEACDLLPEVLPTAGKDYKPNGDQIAYEAASNKFPKDYFQRAGIFFQDHLLKGIAGYSEEKLNASNLETRQTIIAAVDKLLRLPEEAGDVHFLFSKDVDGKRETLEYPLKDLSAKGQAFYQYLLDSRRDGFDAPPALVVDRNAIRKTDRTSSKKRTHGAHEDDDEDDFEADSDGVVWTKNHPSVGTWVAAHFPPLEHHTDLVPKHDNPAQPDTRGVVSQIFRGKVVKYAKPSAPGVCDQMYHIRWEDGDEQDFDELDMERGMDLYDSIEGWTTRHHSVGLRVACYFTVPARKGGKDTEERLFFGTVKKYGTPMSPDDVALYHVVFDDGDEQDFNDAELQLGLELFKKQEAQSKAAGGKKIKSGIDSVTTTSATTTTREKGGTAAATSAKGKPAAVEHSPRNSSPGPRTPRSARKVGGGESVSSEGTTGKRKRGRPVVKAEKDKDQEPPAKKKTTAAAGASGKKTGKGGKVGKAVKKEVITVDDDPVWVMHHPSVGKRVAQYFPVPGSNKLEVFGGTVALYAAPSAPGAKDQLYRVVFDDGDEQDYDEKELQEVLSLIDKLMPTPLIHPSAAALALVKKRQKAMASDFAEKGVNGGSTSITQAAQGSANGSAPAETTEAARVEEDGSADGSSGKGDEDAGNGKGSPSPQPATVAETVSEQGAPAARMQEEQDVGDDFLRVMATDDVDDCVVLE